VERLASVLKFILFDDNFENVAFQGVPLVARIPWTAILSHTSRRVAQSQAGRQKARIGCPVLCRAEAVRRAGRPAGRCGTQPARYPDERECWPPAGADRTARPNPSSPSIMASLGKRGAW
jgi:hypothetical protein